MKKFLEDLKKELNKYSIQEEEIEDILTDHEEMFREAVNEGLKESEIQAKFGNPEVLAKELSLTATIKKESREDSSYVLKNSFNNDNVKNVYLNTTIDDLIIENHDIDSIEILVKNVKEFKDYEVSCEKDTLIVKCKKKKIAFFSSSRNAGKILIKLPQSLELKDINISVISGNCIFGYINSKELTVSSISGDLNLRNINSENAHIKTVSGDADISNIIADNSEFSSVSGDYKISDTTISNEMNMNTVSGDFLVSNTYCKKSVLSTVSGDLKAIDFYPNEVSLKSVSGDITITNEDKSRKINIVRKKSVSGEIKIK